MKISYKVLVALLLLASTASILLIATNRPAHFPDASVRGGDVHPAGLFVNTMKADEFYREQIIRHPDVADNYVKLGQLQIQMARETGDELRYIPQARNLIQQALNREPANYSALVLNASLLNTLHRFDEALPKLEALVAKHPHDAFLRGALVDALVEIGHYDIAVAQSDTMQQLKPGLASYARAAYLRELHGQDEGAVKAMEMAVNAGAPGTSDRSWALFQLGKLYLKRGDSKSAIRVFDGILEESPSYSLALAGLAATALAEERFDDAAELAENGFSATNRVVFLELQLEAQTALGNHDTGALVAGIRKSFQQAEEIGEVVDMELADFLADHEIHLEEAAARIKRETQRRPDHLHVLETQAWVLHKRGQSSEALPIMKRAMRLGTRDAKLYLRASTIARAAGQADLANNWLQQALAFHLKFESVTAWKDVNGYKFD